MRSTTTKDTCDVRPAAALAADGRTDEVDVRVEKVGTFATGHSVAGEVLVATDAPVGSFAVGQTPAEPDPRTS